MRCCAIAIRDGLPRFGVETTDILSEDWGWLVNTKNNTFPVWLGCGPIDDLGGEDDEATDSASVIEFAVFVIAEPRFFRRLFRRVDTKPALERTAAALRCLLESSPEIAEITWSTDS
jgi:hypothetical protein